MFPTLIGLLGALGILLLGMKLLEEGMQFFLSGSVRQYFHTLVQNKYIGRLVGVVITPLLQSSSLVSLILVSFVGSSLISLLEALGVIAGMNVGITLVPLVLSKIGFTGIDLSILALPLIGLGGLILAIFKYPKIQKMSTIAVGFGLILWSIQLMKGAVSGLESYVDLSIYAHLSPWVFLGVGLVATAVIQSSLAVVLIAISAVYSGVLPLEAAIFVVMGSNIGTTTTAMLGAIGRNMTKQQVAIAHVLFNICLALQGWLLIDVYVSLGVYFFADDLHIQVAFINLLLNLMTSILLMCVLPLWHRVVIYIRPDRKQVHLLQTMQSIYASDEHSDLTANTRLGPLLEDIQTYMDLLVEHIHTGENTSDLSHMESHLWGMLGLQRRADDEDEQQHAMIYTKMHRVMVSLNKVRERYKDITRLQAHMQEYPWYHQEDIQGYIQDIYTYIYSKTGHDHAKELDMDNIYQGFSHHMKHIQVGEDNTSDYIQYSGYMHKFHKYISLFVYDRDDACRSLCNAQDIYEDIYM